MELAPECGFSRGALGGVVGFASAPVIGCCYAVSSHFVLSVPVKQHPTADEWGSPVQN